MGCFSWMDCVNPNKNIKMYDKAYVLVPTEFAEKYSERISESSYDCYGHFGGYDIFELVAIWNRDYISEENLDPVVPIEKYGGLYSFEKEDLRRKGVSEEEIEKADQAERKKYYEIGLSSHKRSVKRLNDFKSQLNERKMIEKYGRDYLREIGIDIACGDKKNAVLKYPIKITHSKTAVYEDCEFSRDDVNQGY